VSVIGKLVVAVVGDMSALRKDLNNMQKDLKRTFGKDALDASKALTTGVLGLGAGLAAAGAMGVKFAADLEQTQIAFEVLTGSADTARQMIDEFREMGAKTPYETKNLLDAAQTMMLFGIEADKVKGYLQSLGDVAAGSPEKLKMLTLAFSQVQSAGKLTGQDLLQMVNAGFNPLQIISEKTGKSMSQLKDEMSQGAISSQMVADAFKTATSEGGRFNGMMIKQSDSINGLSSTLTDEFAMTLTKIGQDIIETFNLKEKMKGTISWLGEFRENLEQGGVRQALEKMIPPGLQIAIGAIATAIFAAMLPALGSMAIAAAAAVVPLWPFIAAGAALGATALLVYKNWNQVSAFFMTVWDKVAATMQIALSGIKIYFLSWMLAITQGLETVFGWIPNIGEKIKTANKAVSDMIKQEAENIKKNTQKLTDTTAYDRHVKEMQSKSKSKKDAIVKDSNEETQVVINNNDKQKQSGQELTEAEKNWIEKRKNYETEWTDKLLQETGTRRQILEAEYQDAIAQADKLGADKTAIEAYYKEQRMKLMDEENAAKIAAMDVLAQAIAESEERDRQALEEEKKVYREKAATVIGYVDAVNTGQKTLKDIIKEQLLSWLTSKQVEILASIAAGIATATGQAPFTFGASLAWIPALLSQQGLALGVIEAAKGTIRGLAAGGLVRSGTGGGIFQVGEGPDDELVAPVEKGTNLIAAGIVDILSRMSNSSGNIASSYSGPKSITIINQIDGAEMGRVVAPVVVEEIYVKTGMRP
jgi:tape measure domain-containing protein